MSWEEKEDIRNHKFADECMVKERVGGEKGKV